MKTATKLAWTGGILALGVAAGSTSYALWNADDSMASAKIVSGNLSLSPAGKTVWTETSPEKTTYRGTEIIPSEFLATPGDTFSITQSFTSTLEGENMLGKIGVNWSKPKQQAALPEGVTATYTLKNASGFSTLSTELGEPTTVDNLPVGSNTWTVTVNLVLADSKADRFKDLAELAKLGTIVVDLDQVRTGTGFKP